MAAFQLNRYSVPVVPVFPRDISRPDPKYGKCPEFILRDGRYWEGKPFHVWSPMFKSSPAPRDGRYIVPIATQLRPILVSILARPEGRALPTEALHSSSTLIARFQSSPAPWDGRYREHRWQSSAQTRFNPRPPRGTGATSNDHTTTAYGWQFQSSPAPWDGRYDSGPFRFGQHPLFQSSPAPWDGRYLVVRFIVSKARCFNPRPPRGTGATQNLLCLILPIQVSILARPVGRALLISLAP